MIRKRIVVLALFIPVFIGASQSAIKDVWEPLRFLEGIWEGRGDGMSGVSTVVQEYVFVLNGNFLRMTTKSFFAPQEKNPEGEVHEDIGFFSYDQSREQFIMRGFYIEGFVNQYVGNLSEDGKTLSFETEHVENAPPGTRAKLVFIRTGERELAQSFHVAWPDREYGCMSTNKLKKRKQGGNVKP